MEKCEKDKVTRLDYCQYLLSSQINHTVTNFADHSERFSHDAINRYLSGDKITPRLIWENVRGQIIQTPDAYIISDDTVADKNYSRKIGTVRRQYSGNAHGIIRGIGIVTYVYVNPDKDRFRITDFRISDPDGDGKTKLEHMRDMLTNCVYHRKLSFRAVLMDTWYATKDMMLFIERLGKLYYCPVRDNRLVDDSFGIRPYRHADSPEWSDHELSSGKIVKIKDFPKDHKVELFRVVLSSRRTDYVVTNDMAQDDTSAVRKVCGIRWKIEQFHRETKQLTGIEGCQCRKARIVRNHIGCAISVWVCLKKIAYETGKTIYQIKNGLLSGYLKHQLKSPAVKMVLA